MRKYNYYQDPGHGWVKVPIKELIELGIADKVSHYSYMNKESAFLEEDCDCALFFNAYRAKYGVDPVLREFHTNCRESRIRRYDSYKPRVTKEQLFLNDHFHFVRISN